VRVTKQKLTKLTHIKIGTQLSRGGVQISASQNVDLSLQGASVAAVSFATYSILDLFD
jgi:hypothetical protein